MADKKEPSFTPEQERYIADRVAAAVIAAHHSSAAASGSNGPLRGQAPEPNRRNDAADFVRITVGGPRHEYVIHGRTITHAPQLFLKKDLGWSEEQWTATYRDPNVVIEDADVDGNLVFRQDKEYGSVG